jgi:hypothetical protein
MVHPVIWDALFRHSRLHTRTTMQTYDSKKNLAEHVVQVLSAPRFSLMPDLRPVRGIRELVGAIRLTRILVWSEIHGRSRARTPI